MTGMSLFCAVTPAILLGVFVGVCCRPSRIPKGRSAGEIRRRIEDEQDNER